VSPSPAPRPATRLEEPLRERIRRHLAAFPRRAVADPELRPAAVAVTLVDDEEGRACFLLTRRSATLRAHGGQWALPGGRLDPGEDAPVAALRELAEELGLVLDAGAVLGLLDDYPTRSGFRITPVVAWGGPDVHLEPDPAEVAAAFRVPLDALEAPGVPRFRHIPESERPVVSIPIARVGAEIHAPTAAVLYQLREVALHGRPTRVGHLEQPVFAWR